VAGEVKDAREKSELPPRERRRNGRAVHLAVLATREGLGHAGVCPEGMSLAERRFWGVIIGSGGGATDFAGEQYRLYYSDQFRKISAYNVSNSTVGSLYSEL
jgi:3-oxoacyl-(acyl-carrier-protein) synthase